MKYKVNDKVRIRSWEAMKREFGLTGAGEIDLTFVFTFEMKEFCGKSMYVNKVNGTSYLLDKEINVQFTDDMLEGYAFEYGEDIEFSNDKLDWNYRKYLNYVDGISRPYICVPCNFVKEFINGKMYPTVSYKYARPLQPKPKSKPETIKLITEGFKVVEVNKSDWDLINKIERNS